MSATLGTICSENKSIHPSIPMPEETFKITIELATSRGPGQTYMYDLNGRMLLPSSCEENNVSVQSGIKTCLLTQAGLSPPDMI